MNKAEQRECPSCALESDASLEECPYCGYEFPELSTPRKWVAWLMAFLLVWPLVRLLDWLLGG